MWCETTGQQLPCVVCHRGKVKFSYSPEHKPTLAQQVEGTSREETSKSAGRGNTWKMRMSMSPPPLPHHMHRQRHQLCCAHQTCVTYTRPKRVRIHAVHWRASNFSRQSVNTLEKQVEALVSENLMMKG
jgi:hypothetical protein